MMSLTNEERPKITDVTASILGNMPAQVVGAFLEPQHANAITYHPVPQVSALGVIRDCDEHPPL